MAAAFTTAARALLNPSCRALLAAASKKTAAERYDAALRAASVTAESVLSIRARSATRTDDCWDDLRRAAPEFLGWADAFAVAGLRVDVDVTARDAHDLLRSAEVFHHAVEKSLALPYRQVLPGVLPDAR